MIVVSQPMNKIAITLNKDISCEIICNRIQNLMNSLQHQGQNLSGAVLIIDIVQTTDGGDSHIPKLTYNPDSLT